MHREKQAFSEMIVSLLFCSLSIRDDTVALWRDLVHSRGNLAFLVEEHVRKQNCGSTSLPWVVGNI